MNRCSDNYRRLLTPRRMGVPSEACWPATYLIPGPAFVVPSSSRTRFAAAMTKIKDDTRELGRVGNWFDPVAGARSRPDETRDLVCGFRYTITVDADRGPFTESEYTV